MFINENDAIISMQVYTSGKGSSAAGLTASVMRDPATVRFFNIPTKKSDD